MKLLSFVFFTGTALFVAGCDSNINSMEWFIANPKSARNQVEMCQPIQLYKGEGKSADALAFPEICANAKKALTVIDGKKG